MVYETQVLEKKISLRIFGDLSLATIDGVRDKFLSIAKESGDSEITLYFSKDGVVDSAGIQLLILIYKASYANGGRFRVECPNESVKEVLLSVGLDKIFKIL